MQIRKLTGHDASAFREIRMEMCSRHPDAFAQSTEEVVEMTDEKIAEWTSASDAFPQKFILACFEEDRIIGTAAFKRYDLLKERHRGWIWSVYVRPEGRGRGIGRQLMQQLVDETRSIDGLELLTLTVATTQPDARKLYASLGFIATGLVVHNFKLADGHYIDCEEMILRLYPQ